jgi:hypothetical protein
VVGLAVKMYLHLHDDDEDFRIDGAALAGCDADDLRYWDVQAKHSILAMEEADTDGPGYIAAIVNDMPRPITSVEIGFLTMVAYAAGAGVDRAREVAAY